MRDRIARKVDNLAHRVARMLPRRIVLWCYVRVVSNASRVHRTTELDALSPSQCMKAWDKA